ncbi:hypothetical protein [Streptomyces sp. NPDC002205]
MSVYRTEWMREELERGHRIVPNTDRGTSRLEDRIPPYRLNSNSTLGL